MGRILFFLFIFLIIGGTLEIYSYRALKSKWNSYSNWFRKFLKISFFTFTLSAVLSILGMLIVGNYVPRSASNFFFGFLMINLFVKLTLSLVFLADDLRRITIFSKRKISKKKSGNGW
jgi:hypothetical protein